ncbi:MAG: ATP-binding protein [Deltaproteobacteria bacterium]|nr:ATP-binding protein [Deltaproteobacteria bacterium]
MKIAIASGKGGTGKTTVSLNLARSWGEPVRLLDCDVEEPNCHVFLPHAIEKSDVVTIPVPQVDEELCNACGECSRICAFNAIVALQTKPLVFPELCHGCGGCTKICPQQAITERGERIGVVEIGRKGDITLVQGRLDIGVPLVPPLIRAVKRHAAGAETVILDAPPGTSCPVIATIGDSDFVVLVTEPTPFGLHDLKLAVDLVRKLGLPFGVVINRSGMGDSRVEDFCRREQVPVLLEIPNDREIAVAYSQGRLMVDAFPEYQARFSDLKETICNLIEG